MANTNNCEVMSLTITTKTAVHVTISQIYVCLAYLIRYGDVNIPPMTSQLLTTCYMLSQEILKQQDMSFITSTETGTPQKVLQKKFYAI